MTERREDWPSDPDEAEGGEGGEKGREESGIYYVLGHQLLPPRGTNVRTYVEQVRATRGEEIKGRERERERGERAVADNRIKWSGGRGGARPRKLNRLGLSFG